MGVVVLGGKDAEMPFSAAADGNDESWIRDLLRVISVMQSPDLEIFPLMLVTNAGDLREPVHK